MGIAVFPGEQVQYDLQDELLTVASHMAAGMSRYLELVAEFDEHEYYGSWECRSTAHWLNVRAGVNLRTAQEHVRVALALRGLPLVRDALARGRLSYCKVRAITRIATEATEEALVELAEAGTCGHIERIVKAFRRCTEDDSDALRRYFTVGFDEMGKGVGAFRLEPEEAALVSKVIDLYKDDLSRERSRERSDDSPPVRVNAADAFMAAMESALANGPADLRGCDKYLVAVIHDERDGSTTLEGSGIPAELFQEFSCEARVVAALIGEGEEMRLGRRTYTPSTAQQRALRLRDRNHCRFPGCEQVRKVQAHHVQHWTKDGPTDIDNLVLLCPHHHRAVHRRGYQIVKDPDGRFVFLTPDGSPVSTTAEPIESEPSDLADMHAAAGLPIDGETLKWGYERNVDYSAAVEALAWLEDQQRKRIPVDPPPAA